MEVNAKTLTDQGYVPIGIRLQWMQQTSKKKIFFKHLWQRATLGTSRDFFSPEDNGIALVTGEVSDLIVIDCDVLKDSERDSGVQDGLALFQELVQKHGLPKNTPVQRTASGGLHYFFSLSKSLEQGLDKAGNSAKLKINGAPSSIDTRGDGGCIIIAPSQVDGRKYVFEQPLVSCKELPSMPEWCIDLLNQSNSNSCSHAASTLACNKSNLTRLCSQMSTLSLDSEQQLSVFLNDVKSVIKKTLGTEIGRTWTRTNRNGFDFRPLSIVECALCGTVHESNNYLVRQIIEDCFFMGNYSSHCKTKALNWDKHESLRGVLKTPLGDKPYAQMLNASFRSRGFLLVDAYSPRTKQARLMAFDGQVWRELSTARVLNDISDTCDTILECLLRHIRPAHNADKSQVETIQKQRKKFEIGRAFIGKAMNLKTILAYYRIKHTDETLESRLDQNPDILPVRNGVIDLQTGELRGGAASDYMSRQLDVVFRGLDAKTDVIDEFVGSLFNHDTASIQYLQRLLGYGITGHTDSQVWAMFTGEGGNGKSLLASLLEDLLEDWVVTAPYEIFFRGEQRAREGSHSTHLGTLRGARICIKEEAEPKDKLNTEILKSITGGSSITMRAAYASSFETFKPMALPILLCNHRPEVDITDPAMMRRIVVVPFNNIYTVLDDPKRPYNAKNPAHRIRDPSLKDKLLTESTREQLLVWLVRGAVAWFKDKDLSTQPPAMLAAFKAYNDENDKLQQYVDMHCETGELFYVNAGDFRERFNKAMNTSMMQTKLVGLMAEKGFEATAPRISGTKQKIYKGLRFLGSTNTL